MKKTFKRVPAVEKCFTILEMLSKSREPLGISEIAKKLDMNKSTVFNLVYTLVELEILEHRSESKFHFGTRLYILGNSAGIRSDLIAVVHPYLSEINQRTKLSAFLGIRAGMRAVIVDKVDTAYDIRVSSDVGMRLPLLAGAGGKALLSQADEAEIDRILSETILKPFTPRTCVDKVKYKQIIKQVRKEGIAFDDEEYIEGVIAFAVPILTRRADLQAAIWAVGLKRQVPDSAIPGLTEYLKGAAGKINARFARECLAG